MERVIVTIDVHSEPGTVKARTNDGDEGAFRSLTNEKRVFSEAREPSRVEPRDITLVPTSGNRRRGGSFLHSIAIAFADAQDKVLYGQ
ncbi:hypothetical protein J2T14_000517 [Paenibacillus harenae]|nr:hypothetical protein [Paenibacillus harenae]